MKAHGSRRTYANCRVVRAGFGKKILIKLSVKNRKTARKLPLDD